MKLVAAFAMACGFVAAPMATAGTASALPGPCEGADCVSYVHRGVEAGGPCRVGTRYIYGLTSSGGTVVCGSDRQWRASPPLVGVRTQRTACTPGGVAQSVDGLPLSCVDGTWNPDFTATFF